MRNTKTELTRLRLVPNDVGRELPRTREECIDHVGPCPYVTCQHHLYVDVIGHRGHFKILFPDLEPDEIPETCSLDVADQGAVTLDRVAELMNCTRENIRLIESRVLKKLGAPMRRLLSDNPIKQR